MKATNVVLLISRLLPPPTYYISRQDCLAPPPINFKHEEVNINDTIYDIDFEDHKLTVEEHNEYDLKWGIPCLIVFSLGFWGFCFVGLIWKIWGLGAVFNVGIGLLSLLLAVRIWSFWKGRK